MHGPNCKLRKFCSVGSRVQKVNVLGGVILPVWGSIEIALSKQVFLTSIKHAWKEQDIFWLLKLLIHASICHFELVKFAV